MLKVNSITSQKQIINNKSPQFKGMGEFVIKTMDAVERGGTPASFLSGDLLGNILPRPITGLFRNSKENGGKKNYAYALKELIREVISGPGMFAVPALILYPAIKFVGKALNVPTESINAFTKHFTTATQSVQTLTDPALKENFYKNVFKEALENTNIPKEKSSKLINDLVKRVLNLENAPKKSFWQKLTGKKVKGSYEDGLARITSVIAKLNKRYSSNLSENFSNLTILTSEGRKVTTSPEKLLTHLKNYSDDALKFVRNKSKDGIANLLQNFKKVRIGGRFLVNATMACVIFAFAGIGPKLYNIGKQDPGLVGLEPKKDDGGRV